MIIMASVMASKPGVVKKREDRLNFREIPIAEIWKCLISFALVPALTVQARCQQTGYAVVKEANVKIPMRDGIRLAANILRPDVHGRFPAIRSRTPYGKTEMQFLAEVENRQYQMS
ncbi:MAG: CocE/NonD family hydrolase [Acidobacteriota bacterium]